MMMMNAGRIWRAMVLWLVAQVAAVGQEGGVTVQFSVYLAGGADGGNKENTLSVVRDLHYAMGERAIPLYLKQYRQSIEFPYVGPRTLTFFRVDDSGEEIVRKVVCETTIPSGAKKGVMVMVPGKDGTFKLRPFWVKSGGLKKGRGLVYNLSGNTVGLVVDGKTRVGVKDGGRAEVMGRFKSGEDFGYSKLEGYLSRERRGKATSVKVLNRSVVIPRDDTALFLLIPKQGDYLTVIPLMARGVTDPDREEELKRALPPPPEGGGER